MSSRPFFSIIIPCYNSKPNRIKELLESIVKAGCNDITEIIISDDRSTDKSYLDEIENYKDNFLNIKVITVPDKNEEGIELIHCPGNTREYGVREATGEWISFIDHDDVFVENSFIKIKEGIENSNEKYMISGNLINAANKCKIIKTSTNWMHAKFYNLDNFWKAYDFHFKTNLFSNEDIYISMREYFVFFRLFGNKTSKGNTHINTDVYIWRWNKDSTSNTKYYNESYMEHFFLDYIEATYNTLTDEYNKAIKSNNASDDFIYYCRCLHADSILYMFLYLQSFKYMKRTTYNKEYELVVKDKVKEYYNRYKVDHDYLFNFIRTEKDFNSGVSGNWYIRAKSVVVDGVGWFEEVDSFYDFLKGVKEDSIMINDSDDRPFFSVVIPCYNSKPDRIKELLESIHKCGCPDDVEVIISDDRSTDKSYLEVVKEYTNRLNIKIFNVPDINEEGTELIHCPGNTRQNGVNHATGKWITFIDHDDFFTENSLSDIKQDIMDSGEKYLVASEIRVYNTTNGEEYYLSTPNDTVNWMHGKFYNLDNFWRAYDFHFITNIKSGEDVAVASRTRCIMHSLDLKTNFLEKATYTWRKWPDSLSHTRCDFGLAIVRFHYEYFDDFLRTTMDVFIEEYNKISNPTEKDIEFYKFIQADVLLYIYFYIQVFKYTYGNSFNTFLEAEAKKYIHEFLDRFHMFPCVLYDYVCEYRNDGYELWYTEVKKSVRSHMGYFIETDTFYDFISK